MSEPRVLYHYAAASNRASIERLGLLTRDAAGESLAEVAGYSEGVYRFADIADAWLDEGALFAVDVAGLELVSDPYHDPGVAYFVPHPVPPERIRFVAFTG